MTTFLDPVTASAEAWQTYLGEPGSHERSWNLEIEERFFLFSHLQKIIGIFGETKMPADQRIQVVETAIGASLDIWDGLADFRVSPTTGGTHPFICLPQLAYVRDNPDPQLVSITQLLWFKASRPLDYEDLGYANLLRGLGKHVPLSNDALEQVYTNHFNLYRMDVIEILLQRGAREHAERLFKKRITDFPAVDPLHMHHLVYWGMPTATMEIWLHQGLNGEDSHRHVRASARKRWKEILAHRQF